MKLATNTMSIRLYTPKDTAVYLRVYGRIPGIGRRVYFFVGIFNGRILAVYGRILAVYGRIRQVYGRVRKVYGRIATPWHRMGERYACYTCTCDAPGSYPTALKRANMFFRPLKNPAKKLKSLKINENST